MKCSAFFMLLLIAASAGAEKAYPSQDDCPAMPYINRNPGAEYADSVRLFQGIPSIAAAPGGSLRVTRYGDNTISPPASGGSGGWCFDANETGLKTRIGRFVVQ